MMVGAKCEYSQSPAKHLRRPCSSTMSTMTFQSTSIQQSPNKILAWTSESIRHSAAYLCLLLRRAERRRCCRNCRTHMQGPSYRLDPIHVYVQLSYLQSKGHYLLATATNKPVSPRTFIGFTILASWLTQHPRPYKHKCKSTPKTDHGIAEPRYKSTSTVSTYPGSTAPLQSLMTPP